MWLGWLAGRAEDPEIDEGIKNLHETTEATVHNLRMLLFTLQPVELERQGLGVALEVLLEHAREEFGFSCHLDNRLVVNPSGTSARLLYRATQEALANVRKHARATHVEVLLAQESGQFVLSVRDDGRGFDPDEAMQVRPGHLGLPSLREQVETARGFFRAQSSPGAGSTIEVRIPDMA
jgi:signal transduction histidine kinase